MSNKKQSNLYDIIFINDEVTEAQFVLNIIESIFDKNNEQAKSLLRYIHFNGSGVVGSFPHEIAQQKIKETNFVSIQSLL